MDWWLGALVIVGGWIGMGAVVIGVWDRIGNGLHRRDADRDDTP